MITWNVIVQSFCRHDTEELRFAIVLFDPSGPHIKGPDGGKGMHGYTDLLQFEFATY